MGIYILRNISKELQNSPFLTIMADETTDSSNHEQLVIVFRHVTADLVHEEFLDLYQVSTIEAATLFDIIKDVFT